MIRCTRASALLAGARRWRVRRCLRRSWPVVLDLCVAAIGLAVFYARRAHCDVLGWDRRAEQMVVSLSPRALPLYAFYSVVRIGLAYLLSLVFAIGYGYMAAYNKRLEALMIAALDILQSIPVLSFLPGVMLAMVALFPTRHFGVEMGAIVLHLYRRRCGTWRSASIPRSRAFRASCARPPTSTASRGCSGWCSWSCRTQRSGWSGTR